MKTFTLSLKELGYPVKGGTLTAYVAEGSVAHACERRQKETVTEGELSDSNMIHRHLHALNSSL